MMKKILIMLLALCMPFASLAEEAQATANGVVESSRITYVTAPFSGVLTPFDWETGDRVGAEDELFSVETTKVFSPVNGTVRALFAGEGEHAEDAMMLYGMLASIEKEHCFLINADTDGAYNDSENRRVHAGETVYFQQTNDKDNKGMGRIISVNDEDYVIELLKGDFEDEDDVKIYRDEGMGTKNCIGTGEVAWAADVSVGGSGYVVRCAVEEGDRVQAGDLLFEMIAQDAESGVRSAAIASPASGALEIVVSPGMQVCKGQMLAKVHDLEKLCVVASVDEMDLDSVQEGGSLTLAFTAIRTRWL